MTWASVLAIPNYISLILFFLDARTEREQFVYMDDNAESHRANIINNRLPGTVIISNTAGMH